jgi:hypothetical protein
MVDCLGDHLGQGEAGRSAGVVDILEVVALPAFDVAASHWEEDLAWVGYQEVAFGLVVGEDHVQVAGSAAALDASGKEKAHLEVSGPGHEGTLVVRELQMMVRVGDRPFPLP